MELRVHSVKWLLLNLSKQPSGWTCKCICLPSSGSYQYGLSNFSFGKKNQKTNYVFSENFKRAPILKRYVEEHTDRLRMVTHSSGHTVLMHPLDTKEMRIVRKSFVDTRVGPLYFHEDINPTKPASCFSYLVSYL